MDDTKDILAVDGLTVSFGGRRVVDNLCYTLRRGTTLGIVGESGSGKSISSLALMGLLPPGARAEGRAMLGQTDLLALDERSMRAVRGKRIGMIFQEPMTALNPVHRCGRQVEEMLLAHEPEARDTRRRVVSLFDEVMLPRPEKIFDSYPHQLSGGQRQRVMIAMALVCNPDILIADEPTTALDVTVQKTILDLLRRLQRQHGTSIIFISHDLGVIGQVADDVLVMYRGSVVEQGRADAVLHRPSHPYTQGLLACRPPADARPHRLPTVDDYMQGRVPQAEAEPRGEAGAQTGSVPLLHVDGLTVDYTLRRNLLGRPTQQVQALRGVSFDVMEGETLGLVGESGSGKSTLGRALLRLVEQSSGNVAYRGSRLDRMDSREMRRIRPKMQIIFQDPYSSLNPHMTIGEAIMEPLRVHSKDMRRSEMQATVEELMEQVGLDAAWHGRYPHQLSGGQRQRVGIARALVLRPELVVCDESVSALDVSVQAQVLNLLNDLKERYRLTYLFITHDLSVVHYMADRIIVLRKGSIVESGTPDDIFHNPQTDYTRSLLDAIPRI